MICTVTVWNNSIDCFHVPKSLRDSTMLSLEVAIDNEHVNYFRKRLIQWVRKTPHPVMAQHHHLLVKECFHVLFVCVCNLFPSVVALLPQFNLF